MALKRSGVRSSSAPFTSIGMFSYSSSNSDQVPLRAVLIFVFSAIAFGWGTFTPLSAQSPPARVAPDIVNIPPDVAIFANPIDMNSANVGIGYSTRVSHKDVELDIAALVADNGWHLVGRPRIYDGKKTGNTTAQVQFANAPQVVNGLPSVDPYLRAYQKWNHVEVMFGITDHGEFRNFTTLDTPQLEVQLVRDPGNFRFIAEIRDHTGRLPTITPSQDKSTVSKAGTPLNQGASDQTNSDTNNSLGAGGGSRDRFAKPIAFFCLVCAALISFALGRKLISPGANSKLRR